jgi:hypothetical protein
MNSNTQLSFVVSLHLALFGLILKPQEPGLGGWEYVFGIASFAVLFFGVVYELQIHQPKDEGS